LNLKTPTKRIVVGIMLIIILAGLCTHYASEFEKHRKHPSYGAILSDYPLGEVVNVGGTVTQINSTHILVEENYHGHIVTMKVPKNDPIIKNHTLSPEDRITVVGVLGPDNQMVSVQEINVNSYANYIWLLFRSFLALIVLVYIFNSYWSFDLESFQFRRR
jgi:hypothetical protein